MAACVILWGETSREPITCDFAAASCARLELLAVLWALEQFEIRRRSNHSTLCSRDSRDPSVGTYKNNEIPTLSLYTDSQTIANLTARRGKLKAKNFLSGRTGLPLSNGDLYQHFFTVYDRLSLEFSLEVFWIKGHTPKHGRSDQDTIFAQVDVAARNSLRALTGSPKTAYIT